MTRFPSGSERGLAGVVLDLRVGASGKQNLDDPRPSIHRGGEKGRLAVVVPRVDFRACV